jgi:hypothetical protein
MVARKHAESGVVAGSEVAPDIVLVVSVGRVKVEALDERKRRLILRPATRTDGGRRSVSDPKTTQAPHLPAAGSD